MSTLGSVARSEIDVGTVVVGVDGSPESRTALAWAADEARLRGAALLVAYVYEYTPAWQMYGYGFTTPLVPDQSIEEERAEAARRAFELVQEMADGLGAHDLAVQVVAHEERRPAKGLVEIATGAELVVVGSRGRGGFAGLLLGSVSQQCVQHASCPVVVVPSVGDGSEDATGERSREGA